MGTFESTANVVAQGSDPGSLGGGALWSNTTTETLFRRNDANTAWIGQSEIGMIAMFSGLVAAIPTGWLRCDGAAIS
ncbi:tail fiber protein, partial [candidate division KSB1 bacterium]|nr:tail fiber protein [candidate division KSB1 bacterium]